jgi:hypothetical protein
MLITSFCGLLTFGAITASGQDISFSASADRTSVSLGEQIQVTAQLVSNKKLSGTIMPQIAKNDDFDVVSTNQNQSQSTSINVINGKMTQSVNITYVFYYAIAPKRTGSFTFPALTTAIEGTPYASNPFTISVGKEPAQTSDVKYSLFLNKRSLYAGEQAMLTISIALKANSGAQITQQGFSMSLDRLEKALVKDFSVARLTNQVKVVNELVNGENHSVYKVQLGLFPLKAGTINLASQTLEYIVLKRVRSRGGDPFADFFGGDPFFGGGVQQVQKSVMSNGLSIQVSPLPPPPPDFSGAVGSFALSVAADPKQVAAGDAVTLALVLRGNTRPNSIADITMPPLVDCEVFPPEKHVSIDTNQSGISCQKGYKYLIVPKQEGTVTIPSLSWTYFDPAAKSYKSLLSTPITLAVTKGKAGPAAQTRYLTQEEIRQVGQDIRYIKTGVRLGRQTDQPYKNPLFFVCVPLPFFIALFSFLYKVQSERYEKDSSLMLRRQALRKAKKALTTLRKKDSGLPASEYLTALAGACETFISNKFGFPATGKTLDELKLELSGRGAPAAAVDACAAFFESLDTYRFGMSSLDAASRAALLEKAATLIRDLDTMKKGKHA